MPAFGITLEILNSEQFQRLNDRMLINSAKSPVLAKYRASFLVGIGMYH